MTAPLTNVSSFAKRKPLRDAPLESYHFFLGA